MKLQLYFLPFWCIRKFTGRVDCAGATWCNTVQPLSSKPIYQLITWGLVNLGIIRF